jgi:hypothetical protein
LGECWDLWGGNAALLIPRMPLEINSTE